MVSKHIETPGKNLFLKLYSQEDDTVPHRRNHMASESRPGHVCEFPFHRTHFSNATGMEFKINFELISITKRGSYACYCHQRFS
ncbi:hypothetical protein K439DRAFT_372511 [Ramaria rubella]|nr:hypothetical protein K439DRAFT_645411 [Ramaria rubella]KAF8579705.1 hypothetical protein K439DRAFT_372511 [Ramaria rubella]